MELTFLGIGAAFFPALLNTCAYYETQDRLYVVDCGATAFSALHSLGLLDFPRPITCFITHRHADHTGSLATLISYAKHVSHAPVTLVHPDAALHTLLATQGIAPTAYEFQPTDQYNDAFLQASFSPIHHTSSLPAWGISLTDIHETIYYSGDGESPPAHIWHAFEKRQITKLYLDASLDTHPGHGSFSDLDGQVLPSLKKYIYPMHLDQDYRALIAKQGFGQVSVAPGCRFVKHVGQCSCEETL